MVEHTYHDSHHRFALGVLRKFGETRPDGFSDGFDAGLAHTLQLLEEIANRAGLSTEPGTADIEIALRCIITHLEKDKRDTVDKAS